MAASVCFLVPNLGNMGGSVRVAVQLANALSKDREVSIVSCMHYDKPAFSVDPSVACFDAAIGSGRIREMVARARKALPPLLKKSGCELVFGIGTYETLMAIQPCRSLKIPLVFCDHGALINQWDDKQMRMVRLLCALFSKRTVTLTSRSLEDYARLLHIPRRKLQCIPNAIPAQIADAPHCYNAESKRLLWAGRLDKEKGVDHLISIAAKVLPQHSDWKWDVYGETVMAGSGFDVHAAIKEAGLESQLILKGRVDNMFDLYDSYAICTLTSYREGLPLVLLEGMGCGLPLISFDVNTGPADIIKEGKNGYLIPCYDIDAYARRLSEMMGNASMRSRMSQESLQAARDFSETGIVSSWEELVNSILGS